MGHLTTQKEKLQETNRYVYADTSNKSWGNLILHKKNINKTKNKHFMFIMIKSHSKMKLLTYGQFMIMGPEVCCDKKD